MRSQDRFWSVPPPQPYADPPAPTTRRGDGGSGRVGRGAGAADGFIDDALGHVGQLRVRLADRPQQANASSRRPLCPRSRPTV